jgi:thioredoxin-related protein
MRPLRWLWFIAVVVSVAGPAHAAELIMFYRDGCPYCAAWEREIGPIYDKTEVARRAPLRRVNLDREAAQVVLRSRVIYTPTFVLADGNREVAIIEGYPGDDFFWTLLERMLGQLPARRSRELRIMRPIMAHALRFEHVPSEEIQR